MSWLQRFPMATALLLAVLTLLCGVLAIEYTLESPKTGFGSPTKIPLEAFGIATGTGKRQPGQLIISGYTRGKAIVSNLQGLKNSGRFRYLQFQLRPEELIDNPPLFFWRSSDSRQLHSMTLEDNLLDHIDLRELKGWGGDISEYGFIFNEGQGGSWHLQSVEFYPATLPQILLHNVSNWLEFEVWAQHSINFINGGAANGRLSLVALVGSWVLLTLLIYSLIMRRKKQPLSSKKIALLLLSGWMILDARWLFNLYQQMQVTHNTYAGKSLAAQYEAGLDAARYGFYQHLKDEVLPKTPQFIYILDSKSDYFRAKAPWFLAPHNVFNHDSYPRAEYAKKGGYVLILHPVPGLKYDPHTQSLRWGKQGVLPVSPVYLDPLGSLYQIRQSDN